MSVDHTALAQPPLRPVFAATYLPSSVKLGITIEPGSDCPDGSAATPDWQKVMVEAGYSEDYTALEDAIDDYVKNYLIPHRHLEVIHNG